MDASMTVTDFEVITPSDTADHNGVGFIYSGGTCRVLTERGNTRDLPAAFAGVVHPGRIKRVFLTGTSATAVLLYRG